MCIEAMAIGHAITNNPQSDELDRGPEYIIATISEDASEWTFPAGRIVRHRPRPAVRVHHAKA